MTDFNAEMRLLVCRDQLWYLSALIDDLKTRHPGYAYRDKLEEANKALSQAIDDTNLYNDQRHFDEWEKLIAQTRQLLKKVRFQLKYRGHFAEVICYTDADDDGVQYYGEVIGTDEMITFGGKTLEETKLDFYNVMDRFLDE